MRDERGRRFLFEELPVQRVREALDRGELPSQRDMEIVTKLAEEHLDKRPALKRPTKRDTRIKWIKEIEPKRLLEGLTINDAIREVFTSDEGKLDHVVHDRYVAMYDTGNHRKDIKSIRRMIRLQAAWTKKYTFPLPTMPKLLPDSFMRAVRNIEKLGE